MQGMNAGLSAQEGDDKSMQGGSSQQKLEKMAAQSLTYGSPLAAQPLESSFNYASFAQNSVWDSLRLIWKTFLSSTEADIHELYSPPQEQYLARGEEKGQKYSASSAMMQQDAVLTLPVRAWHESDAKKQEKSAEKSPGRDGSDKGQPVPQEEKKTSARITDSEDLRDEEGDGEKGRSGGEQKDGEEKEKEGKKDKEQGKGRDGRRDEGKGKAKGGTADVEEDEAQDTDGTGSESGNESQDEDNSSEPGVESLSSSDTDRQSETAVDRQRGPGDDRSLGLYSERISEPGAAVGPELLGVRSAETGLGVVPGKTAAEKALEEIRSLSSAPSAKKILQSGQAGEEESAGYMPMWDIEGISGLSAASRNQRGRSLFARVSESRPMFRRRAGDLPFIYTLPAAAGPSPCFPLFAQIYSESTSPMGSHQMPPLKVHVNQDILREDLMEMLEKSVLQPIRMTVRASRFVASVIEDMIKKRFRLRDITKEYFASYVAMMMRMSGEFTFSHSLRTMDLALEIANKAMIEDQEVMEQVGLGAFLKDIGELDFLLSRLPFKEKDGISGFLASRDLRWAGVLHDIGKIRIPREVLYKPGALTDDEFRLMKMHPIYSEQILYPVTTLRFLCPVVRAHHERWDGKGYPDRLEGNSIPMAARIIAIADVFDALISDRPYKKGMPWPRVKKIMTEGRGTHFDPVLLDLFIALVSPRYEKK
jgi:HD-GYP domain-containing protein (c-di-GMP phosphodiesterase class II)